MSPIDDETLRDHLVRRTTSDALGPDERDHLLASSRAIATERRRLTPWPARLNGWLAASAATAAILLVVALVIPKSIQPPAGASVQPGSQATAAPVGSVGPTEQPMSAPKVYSAQELSDMIGGARIGQVVLARAQIGHMMTGQMGCEPPEPCTSHALEDVAGKNVVVVGWRIAPEGEGVRYAADGDVRWLTLLSVPAEPGLFAFRILAEAAEYLGPVVETADAEIVWKIHDVKSGKHDDLTDDLYAVEGWLVRTPQAPCPPPEDYGPHTDMSYWCGGSFVTQELTRPSNTSNVLDPGGLHVQWNAYDHFAPSPATDEQAVVGPQGTEPRFGTYLVRSAGCPSVVMWDCPVWSMVGRLDDLPPPQGDDHPWPAEIAGETVLTVADVRARVQSSDSAEPFLVGGYVWFVQADCFVPDDFPFTPLLAPCDDGYVFKSSGVDLDWADGFHLAILDSSIPLPSGQGSPVVLRVHAHDPLAADCPESYRTSCEWAIVPDEVAWPEPEPPEPTASSEGVEKPPLSVGNWTTLRIAVSVDGMDAAILDPGEVVDPIDAGMLGRLNLPWHVEAWAMNGRQIGRQILTLTVREGDVWHLSPDPSGHSTSHGAAARAELSCGRLDIWSGPPLLGPAPPSSFPPGDCDP